MSKLLHIYSETSDAAMYDILEWDSEIDNMPRENYGQWQYSNSMAKGSYTSSFLSPKECEKENTESNFCATIIRLEILTKEYNWITSKDGELSYSFFVGFRRFWWGCRWSDWVCLMRSKPGPPWAGWHGRQVPIIQIFILNSFSGTEIYHLHGAHWVLWSRYNYIFLPASKYSFISAPAIQRSWLCPFYVMNQGFCTLKDIQRRCNSSKNIIFK